MKTLLKENALVVENNVFLGHKILNDLMNEEIARAFREAPLKTKDFRITDFAIENIHETYFLAQSILANKYLIGKRIRVENGGCKNKANPNDFLVTVVIKILWADNPEKTLVKLIGEIDFSSEKETPYILVTEDTEIFLL